MKILFITQKIKEDDDVLGFVCGWLRTFSGYFDYISVICLEKGEYNLPENIKVFSLGKEKRKSRLLYFCRFFKYLFYLRKSYDVVFCHMNPIYIVLAGFYWRIFNKRVFLWHNHRQGTIVTKLAVLLVNKVFHTSPFAFCSRYKKSKQMPVGVDTEIFKFNSQIIKEKGSILYLGRVSAIKNVELLISSLKILDLEGLGFKFILVGGEDKSDPNYYRKVRQSSLGLMNCGKAQFFNPVRHFQTVEFYNKAEILINLSPPGLFDKTILEAMSCQTLVLTCNPALKQDLPEELFFQEDDSKSLVKAIKNLLLMPAKKKALIGANLRQVVLKKHSLIILAVNLKKEFEKKYEPRKKFC